ncbi:MAG: inositol phosphorylceramide synthase [Chloroflexi bacterium]|nr:inositol phosphorylceramide synthase [Chloroflexota bacterium]MQC48031.1 inositol phosphorylceramide synthase [Chloroflexota bacterium]
MTMRVRAYRYLNRVTAPTRRDLTWFDLIEIGLVAFGFLCYFLVRGAVVDRTGEALANARTIMAVQKSAGLIFEPALNAWALAADWRVDFFNAVYFWLDFPFIIAVGLFLFVRSRFHYTLLRDALLISGALALVMYVSFPVAPPRFLPEWGFVDTLEQFANLSYQAQSIAPFVNPYAAVPSLHVGWSVILAFVVFMATTNRLARVGMVAVLMAQTIAVMATANHYLFDALVGTAVCLVALMIAMWLQSAGYPRVSDYFGRRAALLQARTEGVEMSA